MSKDYYKILEVEKGASKEELKKAFRKKAHEYHPDKQTGNEAKFKEVNEAYQVLSDDQKRAQYDRFGSNGPQFGGQGGQGFGGFGIVSLQAKCTAAHGLGPQKHLQHHEVGVQQGDDGGEDQVSGVHESGLQS